MAGPNLPWLQWIKHGTQTTHMALETGNSFLKARKYQKKADAAKPPLVDQQEAGFLDEINMKRKNLDTGVGYAAGERQADQTVANTQNMMSKVAGGDLGASINSMLLAARMGAQQYSDVFANSQNTQNMLTQMAGGLVSKIADRRMQLQLADRAQYLAQAMNYRQQAHAQGTALINHLNDTDSAGLGMMGGGSGSGTKQSFNGQSPTGNNKQSGLMGGFGGAEGSQGLGGQLGNLSSFAPTTA
jgi:hypothetical protein